MEPSVLAVVLDTLFSGIISGIVVVFITHFLNKRKNDIEMRESEAHTEKMQLEIEHLKAQLLDVRTQIRIIDRFKLDDNRSVVMQEEERTLHEVTR